MFNLEKLQPPDDDQPYRPKDCHGEVLSAFDIVKVLRLPDYIYIDADTEELYDIYKSYEGGYALVKYAPRPDQGGTRVWYGENSLILADTMRITEKDVATYPFIIPPDCVEKVSFNFLTMATLPNFDWIIQRERRDDPFEEDSITTVKNECPLYAILKEITNAPQAQINTAQDLIITALNEEKPEWECTAPQNTSPVSPPLLGEGKSALCQPFDIVRLLPVPAEEKADTNLTAFHAGYRPYENAYALIKYAPLPDGDGWRNWHHNNNTLYVETVTAEADALTTHSLIVPTRYVERLPFNILLMNIFANFEWHVDFEEWKAEKGRIQEWHPHIIKKTKLPVPANTNAYARTKMLLTTPYRRLVSAHKAAAKIIPALCAC